MTCIPLLGILNEALQTKAINWERKEQLSMELEGKKDPRSGPGGSWVGVGPGKQSNLKDVPLIHLWILFQEVRLWEALTAQEDTRNFRKEPSS